MSDGLSVLVRDRTLDVGILLFTDAEVLDFAGPFEVFSVAARIAVRDGLFAHPPFRISAIAAMAAWTKRTASVCTGAFLLAKAGLLKGRTVTTHWEDIDDLRAQFPDMTVVADMPFVDEGARVTSAGISAGIGMSLHLVGRILGEAAAIRTARQMQYDWTPR